MRNAKTVDADASEAVFQDAVIRIAKMRGWECFHPKPHQIRANVWRSDGRGFPDLTMAREGRIIFAELKTAKGNLSVDQKKWLFHLSASKNAEVYVWRPADLEKIAEILA